MRNDKPTLLKCLERKGDNMITHITDENFEAEVLKADVPVIVDFYADWCGPCKMMVPVLDMVSKEQGNKIKIVKLNVDENPATTAAYRVMSIPTLVFFKDGEAKMRIEGAVTKNVVDQKLAKLG